MFIIGPSSIYTPLPLNVGVETEYRWLKMTYMLWSWKWLFKNVISCHQTPIIISPAFGVGGDYPQGCSRQLEKINGWKEMRTNGKINLLTEQNLPFVFSPGDFTFMLEKRKYLCKTQVYKGQTRNRTLSFFPIALWTHINFSSGNTNPILWGTFDGVVVFLVVLSHHS